MITVGIDCGSQYTKAVLLKDGEIVAKAKKTTEFDLEQAAKEAYEAVLQQAGIEAAQVDKIFATGVGKSGVTFADGQLGEVNAVAKGGYYINPEIEMVIDLGAESCRAVSIKDNGQVKRYGINDKCASGAGTFIETMARTLQLDVAEMGEYALRSTKEISINAQCVVFVESEVVSLIHQRENVEDIAHGVLAGIANRVCAIVRGGEIPEKIMLVGGTGYNKGLAVCLGKELKREIILIDEPEYVGAIGTAVYAASQV